MCCLRSRHQLSGRFFSVLQVPPLPLWSGSTFIFVCRLLSSFQCNYFISHLVILSKVFCLFVTQERKVTSIFTTAAAHFSPRWIKYELKSSCSAPRHISLQHPLSALAAVRHKSRPHCLATPGQRNASARMLSDAWLCLSGFQPHFHSHLQRGAFPLDRLQHLSSQPQSIMGRKKIQIQRITDERNKQVSQCYATKRWAVHFFN